jgi:hypothetical protein
MSTEQSQHREEFWKNHIGSWRKSPLDLRTYCREHGISHHTFYYWRKKLNSKLPVVRKPTEPASKAAALFVPMEVSTALASHKERSLPDPKWLAEFAVYVLRGLR